MQNQTQQVAQRGPERRADLVAEREKFLVSEQILRTITLNFHEQNHAEWQSVFSSEGSDVPSCDKWPCQRVRGLLLTEGAAHPA